MKPVWKSAATQSAALLLIAAGLAAWTFIAETRALGGPAPPLDDTYIHLRFAWNISHGGGFAFNPGQPLSGTTSPVWVLLLTPVALLGKPALVYGSIILSIISFLALPLLTRRLGLRLGLRPPLAFAAAAVVALNGRLLFAGLSGMETCLFAGLGLAAVTLRLDRAGQGRGMGALEGALLGVATMVRPEGYLLFVLACIHHLADARARDGRWRPPWAAVAAFAAVVAPYLIFSLDTTGHLLPSTYVAKQADLIRDRMRYLEWTARYLWLENPPGALLLAAALALTVWRMVRDRLAPLATGPGLAAAWPLAYLLASALLTPMPYHFLRYQLPLLPFFILLVARLLDEGASGLGDRIPGVKPAAAAVVLAALWFLPSALSVTRWPAITSLAARNIFQMHVDAGEWLGRAMLPGEKVATMDIGAIGFYSGAEVVDLIGLVTPEIVPAVRMKGVTVERSHAVADFLAGPRPAWLALFPELYPGLIERLNFCAPMRDTRISDNQIAAHDHLVIYRCNWPRQ